MPRVEFVLLADRAEAIGGKLYVLGGGWDQLRTPDAQHAAILSVAVSVILEGEDFDQEHAVISVFDHGFLYGEGVYETLRTYNSHLARVDVVTYKELLDGAERSFALTAPDRPCRPCSGEFPGKPTGPPLRRRTAHSCRRPRTM